MSTRGKCVWGLLALGIVLTGTGVAVASSLLENVGWFVLTMALLCANNPPLWVYLVFLAVTVSLYALFPTGHPLINATPLMLSYVLDYLDERRRKRAAVSIATLGDRGGAFESTTVPQDGPARRSDH